MKVLLLNGSPHEKGCTYTALREAADALEREGIETEKHKKIAVEAAFFLDSIHHL